MQRYLFALLLLAAAAFAQNAAPAAPLHTRDLLWQKMADDVADVQQHFDGVMGVVIRDLTDGHEFLVNADEVFPSASSIKLPLILELYRGTQAGSGAKLMDLYTFRKEDLVDDSAVMQNLTPGVSKVTNRDLAGFVIAVSDNAAANVLIDRVGMDNVNHLLDTLGLHQTRLRRKMIDLTAAKQGRENVTTPREMAMIWEDAYRGKVLNQAMTDDFFTLMSTRQETALRRFLPEDLRVANKSGELDAVRNDSGIVFLKNRPYVISVMTTYARSEPDAEDAIAQISAIAFRYFSTVAGASEYGRKME